MLTDATEDGDRNLAMGSENRRDMSNGRQEKLGVRNAFRIFLRKD